MKKRYQRSKQEPARWLPPRACANCGTAFFTKNEGQLRCEACQPIAKKAAEVHAKAQKKWREKVAELPDTDEQKAHFRDFMTVTGKRG